MRDIHLKVDDDLFERWQKCATHQGQRSYIMRGLIRQLVEALEKELKIHPQTKEEIPRV